MNYIVQLRFEVKSEIEHIDEIINLYELTSNELNILHQEQRKLKNYLLFLDKSIKEDIQDNIVFDEIAIVMHISKSRAYQIFEQAIRKLKHPKIKNIIYKHL